MTLTNNQIEIMENKMTELEQLKVIDLLTDIDCDGETMEFILRKVGMEYQMLRQLMMTMPLEQVEYLLKERKQLV